MLLGYPFTVEWAAEYALNAGFEQNFVFCTAIDVVARATSSIGEGPRFRTIRYRDGIYPFFAVASNDPNELIFPNGSRDESVKKLKEIMGKTRPPTWYPAAA